jgi:hypothetical protein
MSRKETRPKALQSFTSSHRAQGQVEGVVEFAIGQEAGIAGDLGPEGAEPEAPVESDAEWLGLAVTHQDGPSFRLEAAMSDDRTFSPSQAGWP